MLTMVPIVLYLLLMLYIAYRVNKIKQGAENFTEEYFLGSRKMGGFVLAMTLIASYIGASSFIGGPGVAYKLGLGWVLLACIQVPTAFFTLGVVGKKLAIISRRINGITIIDMLRARYKSDAVVILTSLAMLLFFIAAIVAQFVGGARLFESVTGYPYKLGLIIFATVVIIYTSFGGFRAVALTDAIQGIMMLIATGVLFFILLNKGGGMENIMKTIASTHPEMLTPSSNGAITKPFIMSFWILVGIALLGFPATTIRCMGFKDSRSLHRAMIIGTSVVGVLMLGMHLIGVMGVAVEPNIKVGDKIIPLIAIRNLHPIIAGIFIGGPLAAIMSTVDSLLIMTSSTIIKDLYLQYINPNAGQKKIKTLSFISSVGFGIVVFFFSLDPPDLLVWINLLALAGLESTFFCPVVFGLFWKRANKVGAVLSIVSGLTLFVALTLAKIKILNMHNIVPVITLNIIVFIIGSYFGKKPDEKTIDTFFNL